MSMNNSNKRSKKRINALLSSTGVIYAVAIFFVMLIVMIMCLTVFFNITAIKVEGVTLYRQDQILNVGGVIDGLNLVRLNPDSVKSRLEENLVYMDEVTVKKAYPSTLVISCKEAVKAADIKCSEGYYVLSSSGRILEGPNPEPTGEIPVIEGFELDSKFKNPGSELKSEDSFKADILMELLDIIGQLDFKNLGEIDITYRGDIKLYYDGRIEIRLGSSVDMSSKLNYFKIVIDEKLTDDYEGTLIYNGVGNGISAIPKEAAENLIIPPAESQPENSDSEGEEDNQWGETDDNENDWGTSDDNDRGSSDTSNEWNYTTEDGYADSEESYSQW